jgi:hypothetical protein
VNPHLEQVYFTLWSRQFGQRPISVWPHMGHWKNVVLLPINLTPQELHAFSFSIGLRRGRDYASRINT